MARGDKHFRPHMMTGTRVLSSDQAKHLSHDDGLYDVSVLLGFNDAPPVPRRGSAIYLHCTATGDLVTAVGGAVYREALLPWLTSNDAIEVVGRGGAGCSPPSCCSR